jgi:hypothetical protein
METKLNSNKVLFNKLNDYFKHDIKLSIKAFRYLIIVTKEDLFYCINNDNENLSSSEKRKVNSVYMTISGKSFIQLL